MSFIKTELHRYESAKPCGICDRAFFVTLASKRRFQGHSPYCGQCNRRAHVLAFGTRTMSHPIGVGGMVGR